MHCSLGTKETFSEVNPNVYLMIYTFATLNTIIFIIIIFLNIYLESVIEGRLGFLHQI